MQCYNAASVVITSFCNPNLKKHKLGYKREEISKPISPVISASVRGIICFIYLGHNRRCFYDNPAFCRPSLYSPVTQQKCECLCWLIL